MEIWSKEFEVDNNDFHTVEQLRKLKDNFNGQNFLRKKHSIPKYIKKKYKKAEIVIYQHALERWNERVGPSTKNETLSALFKQLIRLNRVSFSGDDYGYIDNDILFVYEWTGPKEISIITFYGRISVNISLQNFSILRRYNKYHEEQLNLTLSKDELQAQNLPIIPRKVIRLFIDSKRHEITTYSIANEAYLIFMEQGEGVHYVHLMKLDKLECACREFPEAMTFLSEIKSSAST